MACAYPKIVFVSPAVESGRHEIDASAALKYGGKHACLNCGELIEHSGNAVQMSVSAFVKQRIAIADMQKAALMTQRVHRPVYTLPTNVEPEHPYADHVASVKEVKEPE